MEKANKKEKNQKVNNSATTKKPVSRKKVEQENQEVPFVPIDKELDIQDVSGAQEVSVVENTTVEPQKKSGLTKGKKIAIAAVAGLFAAGAAVGGVVALTKDKTTCITYYINGQKYELTIDETADLMDTQVSTMLGYDFAGWYLDEGFTQKLNGDHAFRKDAVVYPKFVPKNCEVEYFANNGTGESVVQEVVFDTEYNIVENTFTRPNYIFVGWSTDPNAHYTDDGIISAGQTSTLSAEDMKYYAVWTGKQRTINIYNKGTLVDSITSKYGDSLNLPVYTLANYTFVGFNDASDFTGDIYNGNIDVLFENEVVNLYAQYTRNQTTITFNANGGQGQLADLAVNTKETYEFSAEEISTQRTNLTRQYYTLAGWSENPNAEVPDASFEVSVGETGVTLYAIWERKTTQLTFVSDGVSPIHVTVPQGENYTFTATDFERDDYTLEKFIYNDTEYVVGDTIFVGEADFEIEVVWERNQVAITFNANGGTGSLSAKNVNTNEKYTFSADEIAAQSTNITRQYYTLAGWSENPNAEVSDASFEVSVGETGVTLYAIWERKTTQLTFVSDGETPINVTVSQGDNYTFVEDGFEKDGYELDGFMYDGTKYAVGDTIFVGEIGFKIKVVWARIALVAFDKDIAIVKTTTNEKIALSDIEEGYAIYAPNVSAEDSYYDKDGTRYYFAGWSTTQGATKPDKFIGETIITATNQTQNFYSVYMPADENIGYYYDSYSDSYRASVWARDKITEDNYLCMVPNIYEGKPVKTVDFCKLSGTGNIRVVIAEGVSSVTGDGYEDRTFVSVVIPSSVISLDVTSVFYDDDSGAFMDCGNLRTVVFAEDSKLEYIGMRAFRNCTGLTSIEIPEGVTSIGDSAFDGCTSLTSIEISASVTTIGNSAFSGCTSLTSIVVDENNTVYDSRNNCNAIIETETNTLILGCQNTIIPDSVTSIGDSAFNGCTGLTSIEIPEGVTSIGSYAFRGCTGLTSIKIPASVTTIGASAFRGCSSLKSVEFAEGSSLTNIAGDAFTSCSSLESITFTTSEPSLVGSQKKWNIGATVTIYVPMEHVDSWKSAFPDIADQIVGFGIVETDALVAFDKDIAIVKTITNEKINLSDIKQGDAIYAPNVSVEDSYYDENGVRYYFAGWSTNPDAVKPDTFIGETIITVTNNAQKFYSVYMPADENINYYEYDEDSDSYRASVWVWDEITEDNYLCMVPNIYEGKPVNSVSFGCLYGAGDIRIVIAEGISSIIGCDGYEDRTFVSVVIPSSVTSLDAYDGGSGGYSISPTGNDVEVEPFIIIGGLTGAFMDCDNLRTVVFAEGSQLEYIGIAAFRGCTSLTSIEIPEGVTSMDLNVFFGCDNLQYIFMLSTNPPDDFTGSNLNDNVLIYVPDDYVDVYKTNYTYYADRIRPISEYKIS